MSAATRLLTTLGLALTIVIGGGIPASAGFSDSTGLATTLSTGVVTAPKQVEAKMICAAGADELKIEWWRSPSPGVIGYLVTAHPATAAPYQVVRTGPTDETYLTADQALLSSTPQFTVTTLTSYGWTATSPKAGIKPC